MTAENDLRRYRAEANKYRTDISKASNTVAMQRKKAADAASAASKSRSAATTRSKLAEAERATRAANEAEKKRADLERKLAAAESKITRAQHMNEKEQKAAQAKAIKELRSRTERAAAQFGASRPLGPERLAAVTSGEPRAPRDAESGPRPAADVFLSHASEDKDEIARPLKDALEARGIIVWFDEIQIKVGQSIRQEIEAGIANCCFGIVVISPNFFRKQWTQAELDALFGKRMDSGKDLVLPIWHHVSKDEVSRQSPLLSGILALNSATMTVEEMADALAAVVRG